MNTPAPKISTNRLIASLDEREWERWRAHFERVRLAARDGLYAPDEAVEHLWFPEEGVCSQVVESADGGSVAVAMVGAEGVIGLPAIFGAKHAATRAVAQMNMTALRIRVDDFLANVHDDHPLLKRLERFAGVTLAALSQIAGCNRLHRAEQRLCRWLLMIRDRANSDELPITHDLLALMVGTRRASVTEIAQKLQHRGLIRYERGIIEFIDVSGLEACTCECYDIIKKAYERLMR
jgi:CRP-like cAMP-binding protein